MTIKEQAQQLIELNQKREQNPWGAAVTDLVAHTANHAPAIAQAYLDKCEEVERLREALGSLCFHWDEMLNNVDCGPEFDAREAARQALGENND